MDFPQAPVSSELISAGLNPNNPSMTSVDFAQQMAQNQQQQAQAESSIAAAAQLAKERQSRLLTPDSAVAYIKAALVAKGIDPTDPAVVSSLDALHSTWTENVDAEGNPQPINQSQVDDFVTRLSSQKDIRLNAGAPFQATEADSKNKEDENGDPLVVGQWYTAQQDTNGNAYYTRSNQPASITAAANKGGGSSKVNAEWEKLGNQLDKQLGEIGRTGTAGVMAQNLARANRALLLLQEPTLSSQALAWVTHDIDGIIQGGAPQVAMSGQTGFNTLLSELASKWQSIGGSVTDGVSDDIKNYLVNVLGDMVSQGGKYFEGIVSSDKAVYSDIINAKDAADGTDRTGMERYVQLINEKITPLQSLVESEGGQFTVAPDGTVTFKTTTALPSGTPPTAQKPGIIAGLINGAKNLVGGNKPVAAAPAATVIPNNSNPLNLKGL